MGGASGRLWWVVEGVGVGGWRGGGVRGSRWVERMSWGLEGIDRGILTPTYMLECTIGIKGPSSRA